MEPFARDRIARLRWHGGGDALAARRAAERSLAALEWPGGGSAILCVRRLRGTLRAGRRPEVRRPWHEQLQSLAAAAARPWREAVPADAQAVLFADPAELLACLARDAASGASAGAWWWPALLGAQADRALLVRQWREAPRLVPLVLRRLAARGELVPVLQLLGDAQVRACAHEVAEAYALDVRVARSAPARRKSSAVQDGLAAALAPDGDALRSEVAQVLAAAAGTRTPAAVRLLALSLALTDRPRLAHMAGFPAFLQALEDAAPAAARQPRQERAQATTRGPASTLPATSVAVAQMRSPGIAEARALPAVRSLPRTAPRRGPGERTPPAPRRLEEPGSAAAAQVPPARAAAGRPGPGSGDPPPSRDHPVWRRAPSSGVDAGVPLPALRLRTAFAGTFYLLPVAVHLGWYGDFTQPRAPGLALHPADLLALLGERIAGAAWAEDGLAALLACWAGRAAGDPAGLGFDPGEPLACWLAAREGLLAERAAAALGMPAAEVLAWLAQREGVVTLDEQRVDVHFDLAAHPLAIRMAGLDRDLGWLPAGGRSVAFHFELGLPR